MSGKYPDNKEELLKLYCTRLRECKQREEEREKTRSEFTSLREEADKTDEHLKTIQNTGQLIGEILKKIDEDKYITKLVNGPRYVVNCKKAIDRSKLKVGTRISLDFSTLTIMRILPHPVDPTLYNMMT